MIKIRNDEVGRGRRRPHYRNAAWLLAPVLLLTLTWTASAQDKSTMDLYGFVMLDMGHDFKTIDPNWFDTLRVTKLPSFNNQFGKNNDTFSSVRQTRFGVKTSTPTSVGELKTQFEFEMFGVGVDEGQTTIRLRHAYGELGHFGAGQTWSPFMDPDVFPNSLEYWGPTGMVFYRNVQFRWMPLQGDTNATIALERPGASGDSGKFTDRVQLNNIHGRFPFPDLTGQFTWGKKRGYIRFAGALRRINWDDTLPDAFELGDHVTGWGVNVTSNLNFGANKRTVAKLQFAVGEGVENYMNDSPVDVGAFGDPTDPIQPIKGKPLPLIGWLAFVDHKWNDKWTSSAGYSRQEIDNSGGQAIDAFRIGEYALANIQYLPAPNVMMGAELQWGRRQNFADGFHSDGMKLQFSFRYNFLHKLGV